MLLVVRAVWRSQMVCKAQRGWRRTVVLRAQGVDRGEVALERDGLVTWGWSLVVSCGEPVPEALGEMVEASAPSGCRACPVHLACTCQSQTVGILKIVGIQTSR